MNHIININDDTRKVIKITKTKSYTFSSQNKKYEYVKNISVYNPKQIQKLLVKKITNRIKRLQAIIDDIIASDDSTTTDVIMVIDENFKLQEILKTKYKEFLKKEYYECFLNELMKMNKNLEEKIILMSDAYSTDYEFHDELADEYEVKKGR